MENNKYGFQKLTPINTADIEIYREAINFVFENDDLKNIALSGAYSAGKSSILESYKEKHKKIKFLHISLAHFESTDNNADSMIAKISESEEKTPSTQEQNEDADKTDNGPTIKESTLEGKILNQLIHQIHPKRIPQTNFRVKHRLSFIRLASTSILLAILSIAIIHTIFFNAWKEFVNGFTVTNWAMDLLLFTTRNGFRLAVGLVFVFALTTLIYNLIKVQINKGIVKKLGTDKVEIEIFKDSDDSYFDKYLNEVLYLFERSKADVIVFEDMDRYNANHIFERLREVNTLINVQRRERAESKFINKSIRFLKDIGIRLVKRFKQKKIESSDNIDETTKSKEVTKSKQLYQPLRFLYLLRDDIFVSKDRTKFFDYIIPVIPVMDGSNAGDQFKKHLKEGGVLDLFNEQFLYDFSLYIDDMRILKNIYNEFTVYYNRLKAIKPSADKMLAMIAYKNLFPRDFSETQIKKGFVSALFDNKEKFIEKKKSLLNQKIIELQKDIQNIKKEHLKQVDEVYILNAVANNYQAHYRRNIELNPEYEARKINIEDKENDKIRELEKEIAEFKSDISRISNESLKVLITRETKNEIFSITVENDIKKKSYFTDVRGNPYFDLLKFLISKGHINESYTDYMTYFYPESLSQTDKVFLLNISNQDNKLGYAYELSEPIKVIERLNVLSFEEPEILNFSLMRYLLENKMSNKNFLDAFFMQLRQDENYAYIQDFLTSANKSSLNNNCLPLFVNQLNSSWSDFLQKILGKTDFLEKCRDNFILRTLYHTPDATFKNININNCLTEFISGKEDFLKIVEPNIQQLIMRFELLDVSFEKIDYDTSDKSLFDAVYENNLYEITFDNISQMLTIKYGLENSDDFKCKNYTLILTNPQSPLAKYVSVYFDEYINVVIAYSGDKINDNEKTVLQILNSDIAPETKEAYLNKLETVIVEIKAVKDTNLWHQLVDNALLRASEVNIIEYYIHCGNKINAELIKFVNDDNHEYNYKTIRANYLEKIQSAFFDSVLECNKLNDNHYEEIITSLEWSYNEGGFAVENISDEKMLILIENKVIYMFADSLLFIRENYPTAVLSYIEKNTVEYINLLNEKTFDFDEMISVLDSNISNTHKLDILKLNLTEHAISTVGKKYPDEIKAYILDNHFEVSEIKSLLLSYPKEGTKTKTAIESITIRETDVIYNNKYQIAVELLQKMLDNTTLDNDVKIKLFILTLSLLNEEQCKQFMPQINLEGDYLGIFDKKRPKIKITDFSEQILAVFYEKGWITKFEPEEKEPDYYRVISKRVRAEDEAAFLD